MSACALRADDIDGSMWLADLQSACAENLKSRRVALPRDPANDLSRNYADPNHQSVVSDTPDAQQSSEVSEMRSRTSTVTEFQTATGRLFRAKAARETLADQMGQDDLTIATKNALRAAFGDSNSAIKRVAAVANCGARAAKNWLDGENPPSLLYALRLMAHVPEFQAEVRRLAAMESDLDPNFERAMSEAIAMFQQVSGRGK